MAVLNNTGILMGSSAVTAGSTDYQIEKSLRFNDNDEAYLHKATMGGNGRTWTYAAWIKHHAKPSGDSVNVKWLTCSSKSQMQLKNDGTLLINWDENTHKLETNHLFRDPSGWFHLVITSDTTNSVAADRLRVYINGKQETSFETSLYPDQNDISEWLKAGENIWIGKAHDAGQYGDGYISDVYLIDGLALTPGSFGKLDSTGVFIPTAFTLPTPNDGTDWSDTTAASNGGSLQVGPKANLFDGSITGDCQIGSPDGHMTLTTGTFPIRSTLRFHQRSFSSNYGLRHTLQINDDYYYWSLSAENVWFDIPLRRGYDEVTTFKYSFAGSADKINAIEVDGVILVDEKTDSAVRNNPNNGQTYIPHAQYTMGGGQAPSNPGNSFDGSTGTYGGHTSNSWFTFTPLIPIPFNDKVEIWIQGDSDTNANVEYTFNHSSVAYSSATPSWATANKNTWTTVGSGGGTFTKVSGKNADSSTGGVRLYAIRVDGHILIDEAIDNSFHLKFNDTSTDAALGNNSFLDTVNQPAQAGAILKVKTNNTDFDLDSGVNADPYKAHLVLAIAGNTIADHSHTIKGSGSAVSLTNNNVTASTTQSKFYGTSMYFDGDGDYIDTAAIDTDNKFCMEYWMRPDLIDGMRPFNGSDDLNGNSYVYTELLATGAMKCRQGSIGIIESSAGKISANTWHHIAWTYDGTTQRLFIDGVLEASGNGSWTPPADMKFRLGADESNAASGEYKGYIQDARFYFGTAKYTAAFTPAPGNFTVNNLTTSSTSVTVYGSTMTSDGATARFYDPDGNDAYGVASRFNMFDGSLSTRCGNPESTNLFSWDTSSYSFSGLLEVYGANTSGNTNNIFVNDVDSGVDLPSSAGWTTVGTYNSGINKVHFSAAGGINIYAFRVAGTIITDTLEDSLKDYDVDHVTDTPTNYGEDTGLGGEVRGNYCVWNSVDNIGGLALAQGNLAVKKGSAIGMVLGTLAMPAGGKFYWEVVVPTNSTTAGECYVGIANRWEQGENLYLDRYSMQLKTAGDPYFYTNGSTSQQSIGAHSAGDIIGLAFDVDAGTLKYYRNNSLKYTHTNISTDFLWHPAQSAGTSATEYVQTNFGQRPFKYTAPSGYKCLCSTNLPDTFSEDAVNNPSKYFDIRLWTGDDVDGRDIKGLGFQPDMVWIKARAHTGNHILHDAVRGANEYLVPDSNYAENTDDNALDAFLTDGFTVGNDNWVNQNNKTFCSWNWDAGTSAATASTDGDITPSTQWINAAAGISLAKAGYDTTNSVKTIGTGLNAPVHFAMVKNLDHADNWRLYHKSLSTPNERYLRLDTNDAEVTSTMWSTSNTEFGINGAGLVASGTQNLMAYMFTSIPGFSSFGKYIGTTGYPFIYTGFAPKLVIIKSFSEAGNWGMWDVTRDTVNPSYRRIQAHSNSTESGDDANVYVDILSNGFKLRNSDTDSNGNTRSYVYCAFAEHPLKTSRAR